MADNTTFQTTVATPPSGLIVATRQVSVSGDTADIQLVTLAAVTGSEGAYTVREVFYADDAAFTPATGGVLATGHLFDDVAPDSVDEGDIGISRMSANRNLYVQLRDNAGNERGLNVDGFGNITVNVTGTVTVGSHAVTNAGTFVVQVDGAALTSLQLADDTVYVDDAAWTGDTSKHNLVGGIYQSTPQTITDGRTAPFNMTVNGAMHVAVQGTVTVASHAVTNAGTFVVQENGAALTALQLIDDVVHSGDAALSKYAVIGAVLDDAATGAVTENQANSLRMSSRRALLVEGVASGTAQPISAASGTIASGAVASGAFASGSIASGAIASGAVASGAFAAGSIATGAIADTIVDDNAFTPATTRVFMAGFEADETATDSVDEGDGGAARMTLDRKVIATLYPHTAGGLTVAQLNGSDGGGGVLVATAQVIKASAGQMYGYYIYNPNATATFVHFYNTAAASVTVGTTNPLMSVTIPATSAANLAFPYGVAFSNAGWSAAATTTAGGNTAPGTGLDVTVFYT